MKDEICRAFCGDLQVRTVKAGLAVSTVFATHDDDRIGFYVVHEEGFNTYRIQDDGLTLPYLEASGVDFRSGTRGDALEELLGEYRVSLDAENQEFFMTGVKEADVPEAAPRFVAFSLRVRDFMLMTEFRVATTFREDAKRVLSQVVGARARLQENVPINDTLADFNADFVLRAPGRPPVGVFLGTTDVRILEALLLKMKAVHEVHDTASIVALLEMAKGGISAKVRQQAMNRLNAVTEFRGDEVAAAERILVEAVGTRTLQ